VWLLVALASIVLVELHGPTGQLIYVNPAEVTTIREPLAASHFAREVRCLIYLTNRNFITVRETCDRVRVKLLSNPWYAAP
jgi:hypothetical protein